MVTMKKCRFCRSEFPIKGKQIYCSRKCFGKSEKAKRKEKACLQCGKIFKVYKSLMRVQCCSISCSKKHKPSIIKHTQETKMKIGQANTKYIRDEAGNLVPSSNFIERLRGVNPYKEWRKKVFDRDNFTCQTCGTKKNLQAHHKIHVSECVKKNKIALIYEVSNGVTLCTRCHSKIHGRKINNV